MPVPEWFAYVEATLKDGKLIKGMKNIEKRFQSMGSSLQAIGRSMMAGGAALAAPFALALSVFADMGSKLYDMSAQTGMSVESLSALSHVAEQNSSSLEDVVTATGKMQRVLVQAAGGSKEAKKALAAMGLTLEDLKGLSPEDQMAKIGNAITAIENPAAKTAAAMGIFGKAGAKLIPTLQDMGASIDEAKKFGLIMSTDDARKADALGDSFTLLKATAKSAAVAIGSTLAPSITTVARAISKAVSQVVLFIRENQDLVIAVAIDIARVIALGAVITGIGIAFILAAKAIAVVIATLAVVGTVIGAAGAAISFLLSPVGLVVAAIVAVSAALAGMAGYAIYSSGVVGRVIEYLGKEFGWLLQTFKGAWGGIVDAIKAGNLKLAFEIVIAGAKLAWLEFKNWMVEKFDAIGLDWFDLWKSMKVAFATSISFMLVLLDRFLSELSGLAQMNLPGFFGNPIRDKLEAAQKRVQDAQSLADKKMTEAKEDKAEGKPEADAARAQARTALDEARHELEKLRAQAAKEAGAPGAVPKPKMGALDMNASVKNAAESAGTFSGALAHLIGASGTNVQDKQLKHLENIDKNGAEVAHAVRRGGGLQFT